MGKGRASLGWHEEERSEGKQDGELSQELLLIEVESLFQFHVLPQIFYLGCQQALNCYIHHRVFPHPSL